MGYLKSPLNYVGNKYRVLDELIPALESSNPPYQELPEVKRFVDLFAGGLDVAVNYNATYKPEEVFCNDINKQLIGIYETFQNLSYNDLLMELYDIIGTYGLSQTNSDGYKKLKLDYNEIITQPSTQNNNLSTQNTNLLYQKSVPLALFLLVIYGYNQQLRFNNKGCFNNPFGTNRSYFNQQIQKRLPLFIDAIKKFEFSSLDFRDFDYSKLKEGDLVYCDPPYTLGISPNSDRGRGCEVWRTKDDKDLITVLDGLTSRGVRFALSNVLEHKGQTNEVLTTWAKKYSVQDLDYKYYRGSRKNLAATQTREVLITNESFLIGYNQARTYFFQQYGFKIP